MFRLKATLVATTLMRPWRTGWSADRGVDFLLVAPTRAATTPTLMRDDGPAGERRCFIDEDEAFGIKIELAVEPVLSALQDVRPILLCSVRGLFFHVIPCRSKNRHNVATAKL